LNLRELDLPMYNPDDAGELLPAGSTLIEACKLGITSRSQLAGTLGDGAGA
jgi:hypothetical protein